MSGEDSLFRKARESHISVTTLVQVGLTGIIGYLLQMVLGMDAKMARLDEQMKALNTQVQLHTEHSKESLTVAERTHQSLWEAMRRKADKR
jgi:hypothetical protein